MPAGSLLFVALLVVALAFPFALYGYVNAEAPDEERATSWSDARNRARNDDRSDASRRARGDGRSDRVDERDDDVDGNHWS